MPKYIYSQGAVKQVAEMEKPKERVDGIVNVYYEYQMRYYEETIAGHLASLLTLPLSSIHSNWVEGQELVLDKDFKIGWQYWTPGNWVDCSEEIYNQSANEKRRLAIPIPVAAATSANFMQVVPDSHSWSNIKMLLNFLDHYKNGNCSTNYLIIGLRNTLKNGYDLRQLPAPSSGDSNEENIEDSMGFPFVKMKDGRWYYSYKDFKGLNQHSRIFDTAEQCFLDYSHLCMTREGSQEHEAILTAHASLPGNSEYWQRRCEAAEKLIAVYENGKSQDEWEMAGHQWQQLKSQSPVPAGDKQDEKRKDDALYTYYEIELKNINEEWDTAVCESLEEVLDTLKYLDIHLDDDTETTDGEPRLVIIKGVAMTPIAYRAIKESEI